MIPMKLVIATHSKPVYHKALRNLLASLNYIEHLDEIVIVVSGTPSESEYAVKHFYYTTFGLPMQNILTYRLNSFEYGAFVVMAENIRMFQERYFVFIHDTTQTGPAFWRDIYNIIDQNHPPQILKVGQLFKLTKPLRIEDTFVSEFRMLDGYLTSTEYQSVFLSARWRLTLEKEDAMQFGKEENEDRIQAMIDSTQNIWYPFADNFNMGVATPEFLTQCILPNFYNIQIDKHEAIDIELRLEHPLNFKSLAKGRWCYATRLFGKLVSPEPWKNTTDVYGDGKLRCVCGLVVPDIIKFVRLLQE
jgi:hypothetical protein